MTWPEVKKSHKVTFIRQGWKWFFAPPVGLYHWIFFLILAVPPVYWSDRMNLPSPPDTAWSSFCAIQFLLLSFLSNCLNCAVMHSLNYSICLFMFDGAVAIYIFFFFGGGGGFQSPAGLYILLLLTQLSYLKKATHRNWSLLSPHLRRVFQSAVRLLLQVQAGLAEAGLHHAPPGSHHLPQCPLPCRGENTTNALR